MFNFNDTKVYRPFLWYDVLVFAGVVQRIKKAVLAAYKITGKKTTKSLLTDQDRMDIRGIDTCTCTCMSRLNVVSVDCVNKRKTESLSPSLPPLPPSLPSSLPLLSCIYAAYGNQAQITPTFIDEVFGGTLISTVTCLQCHNVSSFSPSSLNFHKLTAL